MDNRKSEVFDEKKYEEKCKNKKYEEKFKEIESYLPFLRKVINKLGRSGSEEDRPRKAQLEKMQMLYNLLTINKHRLQMPTLLKCEGILIKLHSNMEKWDDTDESQPSTSRASGLQINKKNDEIIIDITDSESPSQKELVNDPESSSEQEILNMKPVPTERKSPPVNIVRHGSSRTNRDKLYRQHNTNHSAYNSNVDNIDLCVSPLPTQSNDTNGNMRDNGVHNKSNNDRIYNKDGSGEKIGMNYQNFKVNNSNILLNSNNAVDSREILSGRSEMLDDEIKTSQSMLTLLNEGLSSSNSNLSISNIGTRRSPKDLPKNSDNSQSSDLESVRKKLAMLSKCSPQLEDSPLALPQLGSSTLLGMESPPAPPPFISQSTMFSDRGIVNAEVSNSYLLNNNLITANMVLPASQQDPRLRKAGMLNTSTVAPQLNFESNTSRNNSDFNTTQKNTNERIYNTLPSYHREDPRLARTARQFNNYDDCSRSKGHVDGRSNNASGRYYNTTSTLNHNRPHFVESSSISIHDHNKAPKINCNIGPSGSSTKNYGNSHIHIGHKSNNAHFNAFRNDKSERVKYFESKKGRPLQEPRTYGEFKAAQARAAAEEAAKKANMNGTIENVSTSHPNSSSMPVCSSESTLDKLYRSSNFSAVEFPNKLTSFKIPKKPITVTSQTKKTDNESDVLDKCTEKENATDKIDVNSSKIDEHANQKNTITGKKIDSNKNSELKNKLEIISNVELKKNLNNEDNIPNSTKDTELKNKSESHKHAEKCNISEIQKQSNTQIQNEDKKKEKESDVKNNSKSDNNLKKKENKTKADNNTEINNSQKPEEQEEISKELPADKQTKPIHRGNICDQFISRRILTRRCSMVVFESASVVDKKKLLTNNILAYEDLQDKRMMKRNKALADMFRKTDDNCTISTENIITGKRSTRTTVNFNEVQQAKAAFNQVHPKKDVNKSNSSNASVSTSFKKPQDLDTSKGKTKNITKTDSSANSTITSEENDNCDTTANTTSSSQSDEKGKKEMLESFVDNLSKPYIDKKYILNLLKQILDDEKLDIVKQIINSADTNNFKSMNIDQEENKVEIPNGDVEPTKIEKKASSSVATEQISTKRRCKKRNELDRLNDDIRNMFICEGVLTATGRRMCTLVAAEQDRQTPDINTTLSIMDPKLLRSKVVLTPITVAQMCKSKRSSDNDRLETDTESLLSDCTTEMSDTSKSVLLSPRTMPALKSQLAEENDLCKVIKSPSKKQKENINLSSIKPCPMSKKLLALAKTKNCTNNKSGEKDIPIKNINPNWHSQSKYANFCILCQITSAFIGAHYKKHHGGEHYSARLAPGVLQKYMEGKKSKPAFGTIHKKEQVWLHCCPFCLKYHRSTITQWMLHFGTHTGEYKFECSKCHRGSCKRNNIQKHCTNNPKNTECFGAPITQNAIFFSKKTDAINAHVCHLCNYTQLLRDNLDRHYIEQHDCEPETVESMGHTINLISLENVPHVNAKKAIEMEVEVFREKNEHVIDESELDSSFDSGHSLLAVLDVRDSYDEESVRNNIQKKVTTKKRGRTKSNENPAVANKRSKIKVEAVQEKIVTPTLDIDGGEHSFDGSNVNAFMPTRDILVDSPTLALNLSAIEKEAENTHSTILRSMPSVVSIAERLSQRIKNFIEPETTGALSISLPLNAIPDVPLDMINDDLVVKNEVLKESNFDPNENQIAECAEKVIDNTLGENVVDNILEENVVNTLEENVVDNTLEENVVDNTLEENVVDNTLEENVVEDTLDDDNWEDLEIVARNTSSSSTTSPASREMRNKNKQRYQTLNRFYNTVGSLNKSKRSPINKKAIFVMDTAESEKLIQSENIENSSSVSTVPFRPMIMSLTELQCDTRSCKSVIDSVPALAPLTPTGLNKTITQSPTLITCEIIEPKNPITVENVLDAVVENRPQLNIKRIQNIGYSSGFLDGCRFYCLSKNCTFLYSNEAIGLENHYMSEHPMVRWNGYCITCNQQIINNQDELPLPFSRELKHAQDIHSAQNDNNGEVVKKLEPPRLKLRRLSGDCLSTTPASKQNINDADNTPTTSLGFINLLTLLKEQPIPTPPPIRSVQNQLTSTTNATAREVIEPRIKNLNNKVTIRIVSPKKIATPNAIEISSPCSLQIAKVISLSETSNTNSNAANHISQSFPKISNVCSLSENKIVDSSGSLWSEQIQNECLELANLAAQSLETSRLPEERLKSTDNTTATNNRSATDSPEPIVVSETVPVAQAKTGNFLITQTVSTQYNNTSIGNSRPQLDFNISIAAAASSSPVKTPLLSLSSQPNKLVNEVMTNTIRLNENTITTPVSVQPPLHTSYICMGNSCSFQTRVMAAMREHIQFHERRNFNFNQRDYMRCSVCDHLSDDVEDYFKHAKEDHQRHTGSESANNNESIENEFKYKLIQAIKDIIILTGIKGSNLYRCVVTGCKSTLTESTYFNHLTYHSTSLPNCKDFHYKCLYCSASYNRPAGIKDHIKKHVRHRYFCYLCMDTTATYEQLLKHFTENHIRTMSLYTSILMDQCDIDNDGQEKIDYLVASNQQLTPLEIQQFRESLVIEWQRRTSESKTHFKPSEMNMLPSNAIFKKEVHCAVCSYKTVVRSNMWRHLKNHSYAVASSNSQQPIVASVDPVNPVPCLINNERHFDKMTNLASSSLIPNNSSNNTVTAATSVFKVNYSFVPEFRRYTCGVIGCQYLTISDDIFRSHLNTLHGDISVYKCPFCQEDICKRTMSVERILQHLRFHGPNLHHCEECNYLHYMKSVVERHIHERHLDKTVNIITHVRDSQNPLEGLTTAFPCMGKRTKNVTGKSQKDTKIVSTVGQVKHISVNQVDAVKPIDTRPLWIRDDPTRVRHIRGILMENEEESEEYQRRLSLQLDYDEPDNTISQDIITPKTDSISDVRANRKSTDEVFMDCYEFSCCQCKYANTNFDQLKIHWKNMHSGNQPFAFRILPQLKCPECLIFTGNHHQLKSHLQSEHNLRSFVAADVRSTHFKLACGSCHLNFINTTSLTSHYRKDGHEPHDIKQLKTEQLGKVLQLKTNDMDQSYMQCKFCNEILSNTSNLEMHIRNRHGNNQAINYTQLKNVFIYCCPICMFMTRDETCTLRHLLDHMGSFRRCNFCNQPQTNFNCYIQHCYSDHREDIRKFPEIHTKEKITRFLQQMVIIFPNGLKIDKKNLRYTKYGSSELMQQLYKEICKTAKEPPIPRLSISRLVARKSIEAQLSSPDSGVEIGNSSKQMTSMSTAAAMQLAGNGNCVPSFTARKISKRRSTVAFGTSEEDQKSIESFGIFNSKKFKAPPVPIFSTSVNTEETTKPVPTTLSDTCVSNVSSTTTCDDVTTKIQVDTCISNLLHTTKTDNATNSMQADTSASNLPHDLKLDPIDDSKIHTSIAVAGKDTKLSVAKFKMLFNINCKVKLKKLDAMKYTPNNEQELENYNSSDGASYKHVKKPCPASQKHKYL